MNRQAILAHVRLAVEKLNEHLPVEKRLPPDERCVVRGPGAHLDSVDLLHLALHLESELERALHRPIDVAGMLVDGREPVFEETLGSLVDALSEFAR